MTGRPAIENRRPIRPQPPESGEATVGTSDEREHIANSGVHSERE